MLHTLIDRHPTHGNNVTAYVKRHALCCCRQPSAVAAGTVRVVLESESMVNARCVLLPRHLVPCTYTLSERGTCAPLSESTEKLHLSAALARHAVAPAWCAARISLLACIVPLTRALCGGMHAMLRRFQAEVADPVLAALRRCGVPAIFVTGGSNSTGSKEKDAPDFVVYAHTQSATFVFTGGEGKVSS